MSVRRSTSDVPPPEDEEFLLWTPLDSLPRVARRCSGGWFASWEPFGDSESGARGVFLDRLGAGYSRAPMPGFEYEEE